MTTIIVTGEKPTELPNPSTHVGFCQWRPMLFAPLQTEAYWRVKQGRSCTLVAPTSSGKTLAVAAPLFEAGRPAVFVLPFRSLILDQSQELVRIAAVFGIPATRFSRIWGGSTKDELANALESDYILITPDKLVSLFIAGRNGNSAALNILSKYDFVFDEIHVFNSMMLTSLRYFLRSVLYWQELRRRKSGFYFLSATFPEEVWQMLKDELGLQDADRIEGVSYTGDVTLMVRPAKTIIKTAEGTVPIAEDIENLGITTDLVGIFNSAYRAWQVCEAINGLLFIGQDKMSELRRRSNFEQFQEDPELCALIGSPAIEAGVDFVARNLVIEESYQDSFVQRFGRAARSGKDAFVLAYSDTLDKMQKEGLLKQHYKRSEFLDLLRQIIPSREPKRLFCGLAAYAFYKFWHQAPDFPMDDAERVLCNRLASQNVDDILAFRGLTPYTHYETGESISFKSLFRKEFAITKDKKVQSGPHPDRYFKSPNRQSPIVAEVQVIAEQENTVAGTVVLTKVRFKELGTHWVLLEIAKATATDNLDDNIRLDLSGNMLGRNDDGSIGSSLIRFYDVDD